MNYNIIRPLIGAVIGYVTNWIAVKMLFRPIKPIKIGKIKLPFTPGIIPKNKSQIAESIGDTISKELLSEESIKENLLSSEIKENVRTKIIEILNTYAESTITVEELLTSKINEENYKLFLEKITEKLSKSIFETVKDSNIGDIMAEQIEFVAKEKMKGSILGIFGGNSIVSNVTTEVSTRINDYIEQNGQELISGMVEKELGKYTAFTVGDMLIGIKNTEIDVVSMTIDIYEKFIIEKISDILKFIDISKIVSDKINSMDMLELEKIILNIMKKELNALVNLGALIGFILGLVNLLF